MKLSATQRAEQEERNDAIAQMARDGMSTREIGDEFQLGQSRVAAILRGYGIRARDPAAKSDRNNEIAQRYRDGETIIQLADAFGITTQRVSQIIRALGVETDAFRGKGILTCKACGETYRRRSFVGPDGVRVRDSPRWCAACATPAARAERRCKHRIIELISRDSGTTAAELVEASGLSLSTVHTALLRLRQMGFIEKWWQDRKVYYRRIGADG